jgi:chloramphenicol-sensitive protein RarD
VTSAPGQVPPHPERTGVAAALGAYLFWGLLPIYFKWIQAAPPLEIIAHRILWSIPLLAGFLLLRDGRRFWARMRLPWRTVLGLLCSGALVVTNWLIFVWAVVNDNVLSTSLGYFITPLVQFLLGFLFLHERMTRMQRLGVVIAASGTLYLGWYLGTPPWISLSLAVTFGLYGLVRKLLDVGPMVGLLWETLLMALPAVAFLGWLIQSDQLYFGTAGVRQDLLLAISGLITVLPLVWFNVAARSLPLSTVGFFQYIAPSMTFLLSVFLWDEPFTRGHAVAFGCIWFALALVSGETWKRSRNRLAGTR